MLYKFRVLKPKPTDWIEREDTSDAAAIQSYHAERVGHHWAENSVGVTLRDTDGTLQERQWFAVFELVDGSTLISRICTSGLSRKGGVQARRQRTLADVAKELGVEEYELAGPWEAEEEYAR